MTFLTQRQRDHGGVEPRVSQGTWDETEVHAGCKQRGGVRMSERMDGDLAFGHASTVCGCTAGALDAGTTHGFSGSKAWLLITPGGRKEPGRVTGGFPGGTEQSQGICG